VSGADRVIEAREDEHADSDDTGVVHVDGRDRADGRQAKEDGDERWCHVRECLPADPVLTDPENREQIDHESDPAFTQGEGSWAGATC
jgi:hypothetical protein